MVEGSIKLGSFYLKIITIKKKNPTFLYYVVAKYISSDINNLLLVMLHINVFVVSAKAAEEVNGAVQRSLGSLLAVKDCCSKDKFQ